MATDRTVSHALVCKPLSYYEVQTHSTNPDKQKKEDKDKGNVAYKRHTTTSCSPCVPTLIETVTND